MEKDSLNFGDYVASAAAAIIVIGALILALLATYNYANAGTLSAAYPQNITAATVTTTGKISTAGNILSGNIIGAANYFLNGRYTERSTAPVLLAGSGWDSGAAISSANGTDNFLLTLAAASGVPTSTGGVITMPSAIDSAGGWRCIAQQASMPIGADRMLDIAQSGIAQVVATNRMISTGAAVAVTAGQSVRVFCRGF